MFYLISVNYRYDQALTLVNLNAIFFYIFGLESFNNLIKTQFMKRNIMSIRGALSKLEEMIIYFCNNRKKFPSWLIKSLHLWQNEILDL
jgi:hypothetical protein